MGNEKKAILLGLSAVLAWSTVATAFKLALEYAEPLNLVFYSSIVSFLILFIANIKQIRNYSSHEIKTNIKASILPGLINPFVYYIILFNSYDLLPASHAQIINYSWGIILAVLSAIMLKKKIGAKSITGIVISFIGTAFVIGGSSISDNEMQIMGYVLAFASAFLWAIYWILNMKDKRKAGEKLFWNFFISIIFLLIYSLIDADILAFSNEVLIYSAYIGTFEMGLTFILWGKALYYSDNTAKISNLIYLSPFLSLIIINAVLKEAIELSAVLGLMLIVVGLIINFSQKKE